MIYDERMLHHRNDVSTNHPEVPERISRAWEGLVTRGLTSRCTLLEVCKGEIMYLNVYIPFVVYMGPPSCSPVFQFKIFPFLLAFSVSYILNSPFSVFLKFYQYY